MEFKIDARFKDKDPPFPTGSKPIVITVVPGISGKKAAGQRSNVDLPNHSGTWHVEDLKTSYGATAVAHEVSHIMQLGTSITRGPRPLDKESYMASVGSGVKMLQRHLDALALEFLKNKSARCLKYQLKFVPWHTSVDAWDQQVGKKHDYYVGRESKANIRADFWVNPDTGEITPAGDTPCAGQGLNPKTNTKQMTQAQFDDCKKSFPEGLGGNSQLFGLSADPGALRSKCSVVQFTATRERFRTTVTGTKVGNQLNLKLDVPDSENAKYTCNPQPPSGAKHDISLGMQGAGALSYNRFTGPDGRHDTRVHLQRSACVIGWHRHARSTAIARQRRGDGASSILPAKSHALRPAVCGLLPRGGTWRPQRHDLAQAVRSRRSPLALRSGAEHQ